MKTVGQMQAFLGNRDQHISADRNPDLRLDRVLGGSVKRLDLVLYRGEGVGLAQVLLISAFRPVGLPPWIGRCRTPATPLSVWAKPPTGWYALR